MGNSVSEDSNSQRAAQVDIVSNTDSYSHLGTQINLIGFQDEDMDFYKHDSFIPSGNSEYLSHRKNKLEFLSQGSECNAFIEEPCSMIQNSILSNEGYMLENQLKNYSYYEKSKDKIYEFYTVCFEENTYFNAIDGENQGFNKDIKMEQCNHEKIESANYDEYENLMHNGSRKSEKSNESSINI